MLGPLFPRPLCVNMYDVCSMFNPTRLGILESRKSAPLFSHSLPLYVFVHVASSFSTRAAIQEDNYTFP